MAFAGGHMNILYLQRKNNKWKFLEGTFYANNDYPGKYGRIWFTFNQEHGWAQHSVDFDRYKFKKLKEIAEELQQ